MDPGADAGYVAGWLRRRALERDHAAAWREARRSECAAAAAALLRFEGVRRVVLFGSLARGEAGPGSDVDLWVEGLREEDWLAALEDVRRAFTAAEVDVVRSESASAALRARVAAEGQVLGAR